MTTWVIAEAVHSAVDESSDFADMVAELTAAVTRGTYELRILENLQHSDLELQDGGCHRFSLAVDAVRAASVVAVYPESLNDAPATRDLRLLFLLSGSVTAPSADAAAAQIVGNADVMRLESTDSGRATVIAASHASLSKRFLRVSFPARAVFGRRALQPRVYDLSFLETGDWQRLARVQRQGRLPPVPHRGLRLRPAWHVQPHGQRACVRMRGALRRLDHCERCARGFHDVNGECVANVRCTPGQCNHGRCRDYEGFPVCTCMRGFESDATGRCTRCADGFEGYPACVVKADPVAEALGCAAPNLPTSLNGPEHARLRRQRGGVGPLLHGPARRDARHSADRLETTLRCGSLPWTRRRSACLRVCFDARGGVVARSSYTPSGSCRATWS